VSNDDVLFSFRLRVIVLAEELGSVRQACRLMEVHPSTFYRWRKLLERYGPELLRPRERRQPQMPNAIPQHIEQRVVAFAVGHPEFGPHRIAAELRKERWGGLVISGNGVWRVLRRHGLQHRRTRLALIAGVVAPPEPKPEPSRPAEPRHLQVERPGELVQMDCFCIGRLSGTKGTVWQFTATDVYSAYTWAELRTTPKNPSARWTSALARRVATELHARGIRLERIMTDNASEFRAQSFQNTLLSLGVRHTFIHAGRPQTNGCVERVQGTILQECWKPAFARYLVVKFTGLQRELAYYLRYYNEERAHRGRHTQGRTPFEALLAFSPLRPNES
jgi:transposase InsO family protein